MSPAASSTSSMRLLAVAGIEVRGRLVEDEHRCVGEQRASERRGAGAGRRRAAVPSSPTSVSSPSGSEATQSPRRARRSASSSSASEASGRASRRFSRIVELKTVRFLAGEGERAADVLLAVLAHVATRDRDAPLVGVEEAEEQVRDRRLSRSARPDERDAPARARAGGRRSGAPAAPRPRSAR